MKTPTANLGVLFLVLTAELAFIGLSNNILLGVCGKIAKIITTKL